MSDTPVPLRPDLKVLDGGAEAPTGWLDLPQRIYARSPIDRSSIRRLRVNRTDALKSAHAGRRQAIYDFWSILTGQVPQISSFGPTGASTDLISLTDAHACFQGLLRPIGEDGDDGRFLAYILKPRTFYRYDGKPPGGHALRQGVPGGLVFVAYARLDEPSDMETIGALTHWHFVEASKEDPMMPMDCDERYETRLW